MANGEGLQSDFQETSEAELQAACVSGVRRTLPVRHNEYHGSQPMFWDDWDPMAMSRFAELPQSNIAARAIRMSQESGVVSRATEISRAGINPATFL
jgi:hypothetical protein